MARFAALNWHELGRDVHQVAAVLRRLGVEPGDRVAQVSENRYEWILLDLAVHLVRGVHVAVHAALAGPQIAWQIRDCGARLAFVSGPEQITKLADTTLPLPLGEGRGEGIRFVSYSPVDSPPPDWRVDRLVI